MPENTDSDPNEETEATLPPAVSGADLAAMVVSNIPGLVDQDAAAPAVNAPGEGIDFSESADDSIVEGISSPEQPPDADD